MTSDPLLAAFDRRLRRHPSEPMVVASGHAASVAEVGGLSRALTERLHDAGVVEGDLVGFAAVNGPGFLAGFLAVRRIGAAALLLDSRAPGVENDRLVRALGAAWIVSCPRTWPRASTDFTLAPTAADAEARRAARAALAPDVAVVKLTSGSTGAPRGIITPSVALVADDAALTASMGLEADERILATIPMSHSYGLSSVVLPALMRRAVLVLPDDARPLAPMLVAREQTVTFLPTVPAFLRAIVRMASPPPLAASVRRVITAGAPLAPQTAARFRTTFGQTVHGFYGASECGGITYDRRGDAGERGTLGTPIEGVRVTLGSGTDTDGGGTITVASDAVARGYLAPPDPGGASADDPDPTLTDGCFRTRDLGFFEDGELVLTGRLDDMINVRGKKVNPREVEDVLARLEGVEAAAVFAGDVLGGNLSGGNSLGGDPVVRCVVACTPGRLAAAEVLAWCRRHLAKHKVPRTVVLVDALPCTARGKLDRRALATLGARHG